MFISNDVYSIIPHEKRELFINRLKHLIVLKQNKHWDELYLLYPSILKSSLTKERYMREKNIWDSDEKYQFIDFIPYHIQESDTDRNQWEIIGCEIDSQDGKRSNMGAIIKAFYENNNWYFDGPGPIQIGIDGPFMECDDIDEWVTGKSQFEDYKDRKGDDKNQITE